MMTYRKMVDAAKAAGVASEKTMWESVDAFSELLEELKESHPQKYWDFMREQHGIAISETHKGETRSLPFLWLC